MKKIGLIDYFLDEWHANQYVDWIHKASGGNMQVTYAYALTDAPGGATNAEWCGIRGIELLTSVKEVVEKSDYLIVLSPDHPEYHERLSELPLQSGKPTYIDKTFAPDRQTAIRLFRLAKKHGTPMYSTSALRYASEMQGIDRSSGMEAICSIGPGKYDNYAVHQVEPIVALMKSKPVKVMHIGTPTSPALIILFENAAQATIRLFDKACPFSIVVQYTSGKSQLVRVETDFFVPFINDMVKFFATGQYIVEPWETVAIVTILEYGLKAADTPYQWLDLPTHGDEGL